jgi:hypothetical protein
LFHLINVITFSFYFYDDLINHLLATMKISDMLHCLTYFVVIDKF